eukprot:1398733-Alexandrium_andersonii.AAC.1
MSGMTLPRINASSAQRTPPGQNEVQDSLSSANEHGPTVRMMSGAEAGTVGTCPGALRARGA